MSIFGNTHVSALNIQRAETFQSENTSYVSYKMCNAGPYTTHNVEWCIDDILMLLNSNVKEVRATAVNAKPPQIEPRPHLKLQFNGYEKDIIEFSLRYPNTFNYVKGDLYLNKKLNMNEKKKIKTIYLNTLEAGKWTYIGTLFKRDIVQAPNEYLYNGVLKLSLTLKVMNNVTTHNDDKSNDINKFLNMSPSADAVIKIKSKDGQEYNVHKKILVSRSAVLKAHFDGTVETQTNVVEAPFETAVLEEVLSYMYGGFAPRLHKMAKDILAAADYYQLDELKSRCEEELGAQLTADNANEMFQLANSFQAALLKRWSSELTKKLQCRQKISSEWEMEFYI